MSETPESDASEVPNPEPTTAQDERFPVVGIGASAGGLEAFRQLLTHIPHVCFQKPEFYAFTPVGSNDHRMRQGIAKSDVVEE